MLQDQFVNTMITSELVPNRFLRDSWLPNSPNSLLNRDANFLAYYAQFLPRETIMTFRIICNKRYMEKCFQNESICNFSEKNSGNYTVTCVCNSSSDRGPRVGIHRRECSKQSFPSRNNERQLFKPVAANQAAAEPSLSAVPLGRRFVQLRIYRTRVLFKILIACSSVCTWNLMRCEFRRPSYAAKQRP